MLIRSELLARHGFVHAFSLREGGVSRGPYASLNLGRSVGDDPIDVAENTRRFAEAVGVRAIHEASQVHGTTVLRVRDEPVADLRPVEADALWTDRAAVGVRTADCMPLLIADPRSGAVAAVHAGWRGLVDGVIERAIDALVAEGAAPSGLVVAIGPHIRLDAFEVSEEVADRIAASAPTADVIERRSPRPHADLAKAARAQLEARGVRDIDDVGGCTAREPARFFSHRRDAGVTGRHLAVIAAR